jgi:hypothetical protein
MPTFRRNILSPSSGLSGDAGKWRDLYRVGGRLREWANQGRPWKLRLCFFETLASTDESTWQQNPEQYRQDQSLFLISLDINLINNYNFTCYFVWVWKLVFHLREEKRLRVFENRLLRGVFKAKRAEVRGWLRKLHRLNKELHNLYSSSEVIRMIKPRNVRWAAHVARIRWEIHSYIILFGKLERKRTLGIFRRRWELVVLLLCSQEPATEGHPEPDEPSPNPVPLRSFLVLSSTYA